MKYPRIYTRPCLHCHRPITQAARNQNYHPACYKQVASQRRSLRRQCRRALLGKFPGDHVALEQLKIRRRTPPKNPRDRRRSYRWHTCATPDCGARFLAGHAARHCDPCRRARRRDQDKRRWQALVARRRHGPNGGLTPAPAAAKPAA